MPYRGTGGVQSGNGLAEAAEFAEALQVGVVCEFWWRICGADFGGLGDFGGYYGFAGKNYALHCHWTGERE